MKSESSQLTALPGADRFNVPPKKPREEHKQVLTVTVDPGHRKWLRENYLALGYRSESHAVDDALRLLIADRSRTQRKPPP